MSLLASVKNKVIVWIWENSLTCKDVTRLASQSLDGPLPFITRIRMRMHMLICVWCERYAKQIRSMHEAMPHYEEHVDRVANKTLPNDAKERMKRALHDKGCEH